MTKRKDWCCVAAKARNKLYEEVYAELKASAQLRIVKTRQNLLLSGDSHIHWGPVAGLPGDRKMPRPEHRFFNEWWDLDIQADDLRQKIREARAAVKKRKAAAITAMRGDLGRPDAGEYTCGT